MKRIQNIKNSLHQEIHLMLPWYVNGTLQQSEIQRVESHLKSCLRCKAELLEQQKLAHCVKNADPLTPQAETAFAALSRKIQQPEPLPIPEAQTASRLFAFGRRYKKTLTEQRFPKTSVFAQAAALLLALGFLFRADYFSASKIPSLQFRTLSSAPITQLQSDEIQVIFDDSAKLKQINQILHAASAEIVSGPDAQGVYIIRTNRQTGQIAELLAKLRRNNFVIFAEPAIAAISPQGSG